MPSPLSEETKLLIESIYDPASLAPHKIATLELIGRGGESAAIPDLAPLLLDRNRDIAQAAANTVCSLSSLLNPDELLWLDHVMRERSPYRWTYPSAWAELKPNQLDRLEKLGTFLLGMAALHFNGYVREGALDRLAVVKNGTELPFLLLRLNDWVTEIRDTAERLVRERLTTDYAQFFVNNLPLLNQIRFGRRGQQQALMALVTNLLQDERSRHAVEAGLHSQNTQIRRSCYRMAFAAGQLDQRAVTVTALYDPDPAIRLWGTHNLSFIADQTFAVHCLSQAGSDQFAAIRRKALQVAAERFPEIAASWLQNALMDPNASVRNFAQFQIGKQTESNLRQFYLERITTSDSRALSTTISGLGEVGASADADFIAGYVSHERPRIRRTALRALTRLRADEYIEVFAKALSDDAPAVSREAMKGLNKTIHLIGGERIWSIFVNAAAGHTRRNALFLIARLGKWESIGYLVEALSTDDERLKSLAQRYISRWYSEFNRGFTDPAKTQMARLAGAVGRCGASLDRPVKELLESIVARSLTGESQKT